MTRLPRWLAALALLAMALVPSGFMPAFGATGPSLVLCPSYGAIPAMDHDGMDHAAMGHGTTDIESDTDTSSSFSKSKNCSLGSVAPAALLPPPAIRTAEQAVRDEAFHPRSTPAPVKSRRLRPPSQAPPVA